MAVSSSIQFHSAGAVLTAYERRGVAAWAIFCNKQFQFKYDGKDVNEGAALLEETLDMLSSSVAVYTLQVYEGLKEKIKSNTAHDGSFNFRLKERESVGEVPGMVGVLADLRRERDEMRAEIMRLQDEASDSEKEDKGGAVLGAIKEYLLPHLGTIIQSFLAPTPAVAGKLGAIPAVPGGDEYERLGRAYGIMRAVDTDIIGKLEVLAGVAHSDPERFKQLVSLVNQM